MSVLLTEGPGSVRERLTGLLAEAADFELRFVPQDAALVTLTAAAWRPEVVILDTRLRGAEALRTLEVLKKEWPGMAVVISAFFFGAFERDAYLGRGADFFFDKSREWSELIEFLRRACAAQAVSKPPDDSWMALVQVLPR